MLTKSLIDNFYKAVDALGLKFPVARIAEVTEENKGNVSKILSRKMEPGEAFLKKFYEGFKIPLPQGVLGNEKNNQLLQGSRPLTIEDFILEKNERIAELKQHNAQLIGLLNTNLTALLQVVQDNQIVGRTTLAYQKAWVDFVVKRDSQGNEKREEELMDTWDSILSEKTGGDGHNSSDAAGRSVSNRKS